MLTYHDVTVTFGWQESRYGGYKQISAVYLELQHGVWLAWLGGVKAQTTR